MGFTSCQGPDGTHRQKCPHSHDACRGDQASRELPRPQPAWKMTEGPRPRSTIARRHVLFKGKFPLFLCFIKVKSKTNLFPDQNFAGTEAAKPAAGTQCLSLSHVSSPLPFGGTLARFWEAHIWLEKVLRATDHRTRGDPLATEAFLTPHRRSPEPGFLGKRSGSRRSALLVAQARLPIPFNTTSASYLRVASRSGGAGEGFPPPGQAQPGRKRSRELLKSGEFQSQRSRQNLSLSPQRGGDSRPAVGGRGR